MLIQKFFFANKCVMRREGNETVKIISDELDIYMLLAKVFTERHLIEQF